jgi:hypothetical protein
MLRTVAVACLVSGAAMGCSSTPTPPPETPAPAKQTSLSVPDSFQPYVFGGERLVGKIVILDIDAAEATVSVEGECTSVRDPMVIRTRGWATGLFALLADSWLEMDSTYLPDLGMPKSGRTAIKIASTERHYSVTYKAGRYGYRYIRNGEPVRREIIPLPAGQRAHDLHSAVLALRAWRPAPQTSAELLVVMGRHLWRLEVTFQGPDVVTTATGPRPAVRIEGLAAKQTGEPDDRPQRKFYLWYSDDTDRVPLRALAESEFGPVEIVTTSYSCPGCTKPCRASGPSTPTKPGTRRAGPDEPGVRPL